MEEEMKEDNGVGEAEVKEKEMVESKKKRKAFSGVVICVTGVPKEVRKQVKECTEMLGGIYSPSLNPKCTHLIILDNNHFSFSPKLQHALNHPLIHIVTLRWFLHCVSNNARFPESSYSLHPSIPRFPHSHPISLYLDSHLSPHLRNKVIDLVSSEGAIVIDKWFAGCGANYVVCEASMVHKYIGHALNIVTPIWILKTFKDTASQRLLGLSPDLARDVGSMLDNIQHATLQQGAYKENGMERHTICERSRLSHNERLEIVKLAKCGIRNRRTRRIQSCEIPLRPINPSSLLDSICWSISEPTSTAAIYVDPILSRSDFDIHKHMVSDGQEKLETDEPFSNPLRSLTDSECNELVFRNAFLTILYPVDRFAEMGPSSRTYFSETGFTCLQLLDFVHDFYQENMSEHEMKVAIHTDSRHAEQLRSMYCSERTPFCENMYKRIQLLGSRKSFELLKRVSGNNNSNVYELVIRE